MGGSDLIAAKLYWADLDETSNLEVNASIHLAGGGDARCGCCTRGRFQRRW
jgi:hypothetical protein